MLRRRNHSRQDYSGLPQVPVDASNADLSTHNGVSLEPACQNCHAKQSGETMLSLCPTCLVVSYCSEECSLQDSAHYDALCTQVVQNRETMATKAIELREKYGVIMDIHECYRQGCSINSCSTSDCDIFRSFVKANSDLADGLCELADQGNTKQLWENALECHLKSLSLIPQSQARFSRTEKELLGRIPIILILLNRLDDACGFIQNYLAYRDYNGGTKVSDWYECQGREGARFEDVVPIARSLESSSRIADGRIPMLVALLVIAMRARPAAAQESWVSTMDNVFLRTDEGRELLPACSTLYEMFSLSDDTLQIEKIREIVDVIDRVDSRVIPDLIAPESQQSPNGSNFLLEYKAKCFLRTPDAVETLRELVNARLETMPSLLDRGIGWAAGAGKCICDSLPDCELIGECICCTLGFIVGVILIILIAIAVVVLVLFFVRILFTMLVVLSGLILDTLCWAHIHKACDYSEDLMNWFIEKG